MKDSILIENVNFAYEDIPVIKKAHFHIEKGAFASFIGPNGGGKTTMAKLILGLLTPDSGYISIFGKTVKQGRRLIGYVPQNALSDNGFPITVFDVALMGRLGKPFGFYSRKDRFLAEQALEEMEIGELKNAPFSKLSGGLKQRVLISRALAAQPEVLLMDEPTANIDVSIESKLFAILKKLHKKLTIIIISHDLTFVSDYVDKVICIDKEVRIHPTSGLDKESLEKTFGQRLKIVRHEKHIEEIHD